MGLLTIANLAFQASPDPQNPTQTRINVALGAGANLLVQNGVLINVAIGVDNMTEQAIIAEGRQIPPLQTVSALLDTGASGLALDTSVVQSLNLVRRGSVVNDTAAGRRNANLFLVSLAFPGSSLKSYPLLRATEVDLGTQPFKCLIGRETMANWHVHYNGQSGFISIAD